MTTGNALNAKPNAGNQHMRLDEGDAAPAATPGREPPLCKKRLFCVDLLRGIDIFFLLVVNYGLLLGGFFKVWPLTSTWAKVLWTHSYTAFQSEPGAVTTGFGFFDFAQPLFIFVTGVSASLAFSKFDSPNVFDAKAFWKRLACRTLMLWAVGSAIRGALTFKLFTGSGTQQNFCLYSDTLHTIAVAYFAASVGMLLRRAGLRAVLGFALVSVAAVVMFVYGDYSRHGNAARLIEEAVYSRIGGKAKDFCYLLTTFTWSGMGILASLMGDVLKSDRAPWRKAGIIAMCGAGALVSGWVLSFWVPPIRFVYTVSFVFETLGLSTLLLAALYVLTDILGTRRGTWVLILFGQCSMAAWVITQFFSSSLTDAANCFVRGIPRLIGTDAYQPIFVAVARAALLVWLLWQWRRLRSCRSAKETLPSRL